MHDKDKEKQQNNNQQERSSIRKSTTNEGEMPQLSSSYHPSTSSSTSNSTPSSQTQRHQPFTTSPTLDIGFAERGGEGVGAVASPLFKPGNLSVVENRSAVVSRTNTAEKHQYSVSSDPNIAISASSWSERKTQSNTDLVHKMAALQVAGRSNTVTGSLARTKKATPKSSRSLLTLKPPRLDTKKIAIIASHKTPDFSPLSANAMDRAGLFLELCSTLHHANYLPLWYRDWIALKTQSDGASRVRAQTAKTFQLLQTLEFERQQTSFFSMRDSHAGSNAVLNRYADVAPYDYCRVKLHHSKTSNYINASLVSSLDGKKTYIATQGPLPSTFGDFWSMVWEQRSAVIVMLSKEEESGRLKCHRYWPDKPGDTKRYFKATEGNLNSICFKVWYSEEIPMFEGSTVIRELIVTREQLIQERGKPYIPESRMVRIVYFSGWNDHDSCDHRQLISLVDIANEVNSAEMNVGPQGEAVTVGPMVIHCSAGIGRTGTFCTADTIFHHLAAAASSPSSIKDTLAYLSSSGGASTTFFNSDENPSSASCLVEPLVTDFLRLPPNDLIAHTVNKFRKQRAGFVQTSAQYHLLYEIVLLRLGDLFQESLQVNWDTTTSIASPVEDSATTNETSKKVVE